MKKHIHYCIVMILFLLPSFYTRAQLPACNKIYLLYNDKIYNYDPALPMSATNPAQNTILPPVGSQGITVSTVLATAGTVNTFYTCVYVGSNANYYYCDPVTLSWVNTGHTTGNSAALNFAAGGGYIYNLVGASGTIYRYDGTGDGTYLTNVPGFAFGRPYDLVADCEGNWYVMNYSYPPAGNSTQNLRKFSPSGTLLQTWTINNPNNLNLLPGGGFAIIGSNLYTDNAAGGTGITAYTLGSTALTANTNSVIPTSVGILNSIYDMASCAGAVPNLPTIIISPSTTNYCTGQPITFTAVQTGGGTNPAYQWLVNGNNVGTNQPVYTYTPSAGDVVTCVLTSNSPCASITAVTSNAITITSATTFTPAISIVASANPFCLGAPVTFTATPVNGGTAPHYQWKVNGANVGTNSAAYSYIPTPGDVVTCILTSNNPCASPLTVTGNTITMQPGNALVPSLTVNASVNNSCSGTPVSFTAVPVNGGTNPFFQWKVNGSNVGTNSTGYTYAPAAGDIVSCVMTSSVACANPPVVADTAPAITIIPKPLPPSGIATYTYCQFEPTLPLSVTGQHILWYTSATGGTGSAAQPTVTATAAGVVHWWVTQTVNGCESDRLMITVTVHPKPAPPVVHTPVMLCLNDPAAPLTATGAGLKWYAAPAGGNGNATAPVPYTGLQDTLTWWVSQTVNGCESDRSKLEVYIYNKPNAAIVASRPALCQYDTMSFRYFGNALPGAQYDWHVPFRAGTILSGSGQGPVIVRFDSAGDYNVRVQVNNHGCVSNEALQVVHVRPVPVVRIAMKDDACLDEAVTVSLAYAAPAIDQYAWGFDGGTILYGSFDGGPYGVQWHTPGRHIVTLTATANGCTAKPYRDTITIHGLPDARILDVSSKDICSGDSILLRGTLADSGATYLWGPQPYFGNYTATGPDVWAVVQHTGYIRFEMGSAWGCTASDSVLIAARPCCEVYFPNAFTPNKDGHNDLFRVISVGHHKISNFRVINRWGQTVFETADERRGWDGTFGGADQPIGTYYYYIKYECEVGHFIEQKGEVTLLR